MTTLRTFVEHTGPARLDRRTKNLARRLKPDDIAIIDHADLDRSERGGLARGVEIHRLQRADLGVAFIDDVLATPVANVICLAHQAFLPA